MRLPREAALVAVMIFWAAVQATAQEAPAAAPSRAKAAPAGALPQGAPGQPAQPGAPGQPPGQPGDAAKAAEAGVKTTPRPQKPAVPADPKELEVKLDDDGLVKFNFQGQPWLGVLEWLAKISNQSLDYQELPGDFLNLRTQRRYTVDEARSLINRHLLDRSFTLLRNGEVLTVVNLKKLDPSLVPRVRPADLEKHDRNEFVKVSFPLEWLMADAAVEEFKPMLSPNGKLNALKSTNRLEAIDAASNLFEIHKLLSDEQSGQGRKRLVSEFKLEHVRAIEVFDALHDILGIEKKPSPAQPESPDQAMMRQQQAMMRAQQQQQQGGQPQPAKPKPEVHLFVNPRENSVVAHAPADQMAVITETVKLLDVPKDASRSLMKNIGRMQVHRMSTVDPDAFVKMLNELGELDPTTRLQSDKKNRSVIAHASLADHMMIRMLINKLDGSDRKFEVIKLRRLEADYVAGTIEFMMGGSDKNKQQTRNPYEYLIFGMRPPQQEEESRKFKVDADVDNNRLLLWANEVELGEIHNLLVKLGEVPGGSGNPATFRVLDTIDPDEADELLRRLQRTWPGISPNRLEFGPGAEPRPRTQPDPAETEKTPRARPTNKSSRDADAVQPAPRAADATDRPSLDRGLRRIPVELVALAEGTDESRTTDAPRRNVPDANEKSPAGVTVQEPRAAALPDEAGDEESLPPPFGRGKPARPQNPAPIRIGRGPDGRLVVSSDDPAALDQLEDLIAEIAPPRREYKVFKMKYRSTWSWGVAQNLKDFFAETDKDKKARTTFDPWFGRMMPAQNDDTGRRLSKRRPLKFIDDSDSNSILVVGADAQQLKIIQDLIDVYDVEEQKDSGAARLTKVYHIKHSKSRIIADALKEVYRDLLSVNDPAMQQNKANDKERPPERSFTYIYGSSGGDDGKKPDTPVKFKGALSIGVDELSNTLIVSAGAGLLESVEDTIKTLDDAARSMVPRMQVLKSSRHIDVSDMQQRLSKMVTKPQPPPQQKGQNPQQPKNQEPQERGGEQSTVIFN